MGLVEIALTVGIAALSILNVWLLFAVQSFRETLKELRVADTLLGKELAAMNVLVQGQYVTRTEFQQGMKDQTTTILTRMEDIGKRYGAYGDHRGGAK